MDTSLSRGLRALLAVAAVLVLVAGVSLWVFAPRTAEWFAWTLKPPLSAAFLGAMFWSTLGPLVVAVRRDRWEVARASVPATLGFATPLLVATLLHLDRFHFGSEHPSAVFAAWLWLVVYVVVPPLLSVLAWQQARRTPLPPGRTPLPRWLRAAVAALGVVGLALGLWLFLAPDAAGWWLWPVTPLAARAVASGLLGVGTGSLAVAVDGDLERGRLAFLSYAALGVLQLGALARFGDAVDAARPATWAYVAALVAVTAVGVAALARLRRARAAGVTVPAAR